MSTQNFDPSDQEMIMMNNMNMMKVQQSFMMKQNMNPNPQMNDQFEENDDKADTRKTGASFLFQTFGETTSIQCIPKFVSANEYFRSIIWLCIFFAGLSCIVWQIYLSVTKYYEYGVTSKVNRTTFQELAFPGVTFCNLSPVKFSQTINETELYNKLKALQTPPSSSTTTAQPSGGGGGGSSGGGGLGIATTVVPAGAIATTVPAVGIATSVVPAGGIATTVVPAVGIATTVVPAGGIATTVVPAGGIATTPGGTPPPPGKRRKRAALNNLLNSYVPQPNEPSNFFTEDEDVYNRKLIFGEDAGSRPMDSDMENLQEVQAMVSALDDDVKIGIGSHIDDMLFSCAWNMYTCNSSDFTSFYDSKYGNCYTFNVLANSTQKKSNQVGPVYGLVLQLYVNQKDYATALAESAGVRIVIHDISRYPFPEDQGINAGPGKLTSIGISETQIQRMTGNYGDCKNYNDDEGRQRDAYYGLMPTSKYTRMGCMNTCLQSNVINTCGCFHPNYPHTGRAFTSVKINGTDTDPMDLMKCNLTSSSQNVMCYGRVRVKFISDQLGCSKRCPQNCDEIEHSLTISTAAWPATNKEPMLSHSLQTKGMIDDAGNGKAFATENLVRIEVYYTSLDKSQITEEEAYSINNLLSDFGGQMGLWLGLTVASIFEIVELFFDLFVYSIKAFGFYCCKKKKVATQTLTPKSVKAW